MSSKQCKCISWGPHCLDLNISFDNGEEMLTGQPFIIYLPKIHCEGVCVTAIILCVSGCHFHAKQCPVKYYLGVHICMTGIWALFSLGDNYPSAGR